MQKRLAEIECGFFCYSFLCFLILSLFSHSFLSLSSLFVSTLFFDIVAIPFRGMFPKALTLTISSEMAMYLDKYHNTVIGEGENVWGAKRREGDRERGKKERERRMNFGESMRR